MIMELCQLEVQNHLKCDLTLYWSKVPEPDESLTIWDGPVNSLDLLVADRLRLEQKRSNLEWNWFCPSHSKQTNEQKRLVQRSRKLKQGKANAKAQTDGINPSLFSIRTTGSHCHFYPLKMFKCNATNTKYQHCSS